MEYALSEVRKKQATFTYGIPIVKILRWSLDRLIL